MYLRPLEDNIIQIIHKNNSFGSQINGSVLVKLSQNDWIYEKDESLLIKNLFTYHNMLAIKLERTSKNLLMKNSINNTNI